MKKVDKLFLVRGILFVSLEKKGIKLKRFDKCSRNHLIHLSNLHLGTKWHSHVSTEDLFKHYFPLGFPAHDTIAYAQFVQGVSRSERV